MGRQLSEAQYQNELELRLASRSQVHIANHLGITHGRVSKTLKRERISGILRPRPRPGRPKASPVREGCYLLRLTHQHMMNTTTQLRGQ